MKLGLNTGWRCTGGGISEGICAFCAVPRTRQDATDSALVSQYASHYSWTYHTKLYLDDLFNCQTYPPGLLNSVRQKGEAASRGSLRAAGGADMTKHRFICLCVFYSRAGHRAEDAQGGFGSCTCKNLLDLVIPKSFAPRELPRRAPCGQGAPPAIPPWLSPWAGGHHPARGAQTTTLLS